MAKGDTIEELKERWSKYRAKTYRLIPEEMELGAKDICQQVKRLNVGGRLIPPPDILAAAFGRLGSIEFASIDRTDPWQNWANGLGETPEGSTTGDVKEEKEDDLSETDADPDDIMRKRIKTIESDMEEIERQIEKDLQHWYRDSD